MDVNQKFGLAGLTAAQLLNLYKSRSASPVEVVETLLVEIAQKNPILNALVTIDSEGALASARKAETKFAKGEPVGLLEGIPFTLKDVYATAGLRTTWGSAFFKDQVPKKTAAIARKLRAAGAILLGKSNCPEFAYALYTDNAVFGATLNPCNETRVPGGSSGGDAAAVAALMAPVGIGSDLGGSIRVPAHCCGLFGFIASPGRVSNEGHCPAGTPLAGALVRPGFLTRCVDDIVLALLATEGFNYLDPFSEPFISPIGTKHLQPASGLRCAILDFSDQLEISGEVAGALEDAGRILTANGGRLRSTKFQLAGELLRTQCTLVGTGLKSSLEAMLGQKYPDDSLTIVNYVDIPPSAGAVTNLLAAYGLQAAIRTLVNALFLQVDVAVLPILGDTAFELKDSRGLRVDAASQLQMTQANFFAILAGLPAVAVPLRKGGDGLPIGVQLVAQRGGDELLLRAALTIEANMRTPG
jgi:amidase